MNLIDQLANSLGFHSSYTGAFGDQVFANDKAKRALLEAMGFELDEDSLADSIDILKSKQWINVLPTVHIAKLEEHQHIIKISLPKIDDVLLHWKILLDKDGKSASKINNEIKG